MNLLFRRLHRWVSIVAFALVTYVAVTGALLSIDDILVRIRPGYPAMLMRLGFDTGSEAFPPVDNFPVQLEPMTALRSLDVGLAGAHGAGAGPIQAIRLRMDGPRPQFIAITPKVAAGRIAIDGATGSPITRFTADPNVYLFSLRGHQVLKRLHRGDFGVGVVGRWFSLATGLALVFLIGSGIQMYLTIWSRRRAQGRRTLFW